MPPPGAPADVPNQLGRYELVAPIGRGGMAAVHLAVARGPAEFEKLVVVKLVHDHLAGDRAVGELLAGEARHAARIRHPNVVEVYELGEADGRYFLAMEYLEGEALLDVLRLAGAGGRRLDPLATARVIAEAAEGLDAVHRLKAPDGRPLELVHHDVSPGNIVVLYSGLVKLVDLGVAKASGPAKGARVHGKLGYMAPEKLRDRGVDRRSDVWSLGCVLWEALTLQRLFQGPSDAETARRVLDQEIVPPSQLDAQLPRELDAITARALARDPDQRYPTAKALAADLEELLRERRFSARNDAIGRYMGEVFEARIAAREQVMAEIAGRRAPSAAVLEAAFGEERPPGPSPSPSPSPSASAGVGPRAEARPVISEPPSEETDLEETVHEATTTVETPPNPPGWKPAPVAATAAETTEVTEATEATEATEVTEATETTEATTPRTKPPSPPSRLRPPTNAPAASRLSASVLAAPRPPTSSLAAPRSPTSSLAAPRPPTSSLAAPRPPTNAAVAISPPAMPVPLSGGFQPMRPLPPGEENPFAEEDEPQTFADMVPASPEASRSLQSEPTWMGTRQSTSLGELQRWVQESRAPTPPKRGEAVTRWWSQWNQRVTAWTYQRGVPRWAPYVALGVVLLSMLVLLARCAAQSG